MPDLIPADKRELFLGQAGELFVVQKNLTCAGLVQTTNDIEQGGLATA